MNLDAIILAELQRGGPPLWVSGRTYPKGWEVRSPVNLQRYVRKVAGAGAADPSADAANWEPWSKAVDTTLEALATSVANVKTVADALAVSVANVKAVVDSSAAAPRGIKSIQRGVTSGGGINNTTTNVAITPVNLNKSYITILSNVVHSGSSTVSSENRVEFVNASTIKVTGQHLNTGNDRLPFAVSWQVIEEY